MRKFFWVLSISLLLIFMLYLGFLLYPFKAYNKNLYVWCDSLNIRKTPNVNSTVIEKVEQGSMIEYLNKKTFLNQIIIINGKVCNEPWLKVKTFNNVGWAYGGALREEDPVVKNVATAFSNIDGTQLVTVKPNVDNGENFKKAICPGGLVYSLSYFGKKDQNSSTALSDHFDDYGGYYYNIKGGEVNENDSCLLATEKFFKNRKILKSKPLIDKKIDQATINKIETIKNWTVKRSWSLVSTSDKGEFHLVLFERKGKKALACIVFISTGKLVFMDFPGDDRIDGTWVLGDEGQIAPNQFGIMDIFKTPAGIEFLMYFYGGEGINIYYEQEMGNTFFPVIHDYRYTVN